MGRARTTPFGVELRGELVTPQELRCATALSEGATSKEAAHTLGIGQKTLDTHMYNLRRKLKVRTTAHMIRRMIELGYIRVGVVPISPDQLENLLKESVGAAFAALASRLQQPQRPTP